jgi:hypothetical protein
MNLNTNILALRHVRQARVESKSPNSVEALCLEAFHTASKIICKGRREREESFLFVFQKAHHLEAEEVLCVVYKTHTQHITYYY